MNARILLLFVLSILAGCQSDSLVNFKEKGQAKIKALTEELKMIRTKDQLIEKRHFIRRHFQDLQELEAQIKFHAIFHPLESFPDLNPKDKEISDLLKSEILRIYRLDGGKEIIDECRQSINYLNSIK